jgi:hypothetical protein
MKGQVSGLVMDVIIVVVLLFIGLFFITTTAALQPASSLSAYSYGAFSNTSSGVANTSRYQNMTFNISEASISGLTPTESVYFAYVNYNTTANYTLNATFNGGLIFNSTALNGTTSISSAYTVTCLNGINNLTFGSTALGTSAQNNNVTILNATSNCANSTAATWVNTTFTGLITNTGTIYQVLILVVIIIALGVAIMFLRGFTGIAGKQQGVPVSI